MNHRYRRFMTALALCLLPGLALADVKISLRLHGGWAYLSGGDVNKGTQALFDWGKTYFAPPGGGEVISGGYRPLHLGYEVGGELIAAFTPKVGIGLGAGYIRMSRSREDSSWISITPDPGIFFGYLIREIAELYAVPIWLALHLDMPISSRIGITTNAGLSWYLQPRYRAEWIVSQSSMYMPIYNTITTSVEQKKLPIGLQAGVGIEYRLLPKIGLFVEGRGRLARLRGFKGTSASVPGEGGGTLPSFSEQGELYYESVPMLPGAPRLIMVQSSPPAGPDGEPRRAIVDLSGVSLLAGFRIYF